jgi:dolichol-phosphate mannosyltransferase
VVPCYNEEAVLPELHRRLAPVCQHTAGNDYEIILVNDGSIDHTWTVMQSLANQDPQIVSVNLSRNHGHQLALSAGLKLCRGSRLLILDADLQDPPELLPEMMALMDAGANVVYGQRLHRQGDSAFKKATAHLFYRMLSRLTEVEIPVDTGDFRLIDRKVIDALNDLPEHYRFVRGLVAWLGFKQVPLVYRREARYAGRSKYPLRKMIRFAGDAITGFSMAPLRFSSYLAAGFILLAFLLGLYTLWVWLKGDVVRGWASILLPSLIFSGVQLFILGVLGEYVGRTYMEAKRRPLFLIDEIYTQPAAASSGVPVRVAGTAPEGRG